MHTWYVTFKELENKSKLFQCVFYVHFCYNSPIEKNGNEVTCFANYLNHQNGIHKYLTLYFLLLWIIYIKIECSIIISRHVLIIIQQRI